MTLISSPPETPEVLPDPLEWPAVQEALVHVGLQWELLDHRETRYVFSRLEDFQENVDLLRRRYQELKDAPRLDDCRRFPDHRTANEFLGFNRAYRRHIEARQPVEHDRGHELRTAAKETDALYQVWDAVRDARCEYYYVAVRRQALKRLRCMLGEGDFAEGRLPPVVPIWRFEEN